MGGIFQNTRECVYNKNTCAQVSERITLRWVRRDFRAAAGFSQLGYFIPPWREKKFQPRMRIRQSPEILGNEIVCTCTDCLIARSLSRRPADFLCRCVRVGWKEIKLPKRLANEISNDGLAPRFVDCCCW